MCLEVSCKKIKGIIASINKTKIYYFFQDYPLSYTRIINGTRVGMGVAFQLLEFLTEKFNFTYEIVLTEKNVVGSTKDMDGSILKLLQDGVSLLIVEKCSFSVLKFNYFFSVYL